jgi:hypothetical protein
MTQIKTDSDCTAVAQAIIDSLPLEMLFFVAAVRVQVGDASGVFSVYHLARALSGVKTLIYGVHMPAFRCALALRSSRDEKRSMMTDRLFVRSIARLFVFLTSKLDLFSVSLFANSSGDRRVT